jgi:tetratricopeptide (TPR) repeat protein
MVEILAYMRTEARVALDRQVTFVPDLLNGAGVVNARNVAEHYLLLVGSEVGGRRPLGAVRHELLHFMIDPLMRKYEAHLPEAEPFLASVRRLAAPRPGYDRDLPLVAVESLIGAIELRLGRDAGRDDRTAVSARFKQGLVLVPYFLEVLERFEGGSGSLQEAFPDLVRGIEWRAEKGRADAIARLDAELAAGGAAGAAAGDGAAARRARLSRANSLLQARDFAAARPVLEEILRESPEDPNALFGLAQIASQGDQLDAALDLYGRAAQHAGRESWIAGWSGVRRGSILEFRGDAAAARAEWERVLALAGDLRGSREAAARALEKLAGDRRSPR